MSEDASLFHPGDWLVHSRYGVGQVTGTDTKKIGDQEQKYFIVETFNAKYWLPVDRTDVSHIRPVRSKYAFDKVLRVIRKKPRTMQSNYKMREKRISQVLSEGALVGLGRLIRDLSGKQNKKTLTITEKESLESIKKRFINEWTVAADIDEHEAEQKLQEALAQSAKKLEENDSKN